MSILFFDTESCGLTGPLVLIQTKELGQPPQVYHVWDEPVKDTLQLLRLLCQWQICGWNLAHDWFHVNKFYNLLHHYDETWPNEPLEVTRLAWLEAELCKRGTDDHARFCLKPEGALDLFLYARTGPLQKLMVPRSEKSVIKLKKVPSVAVEHIIDRLPVPDPIFFHRATQKTWQVKDTNDPNFKDIILRFAPSMGLKPVYNYIFKKETIDYPIPERYLFKETEWKPWGGLWPLYIQKHIDFWKTERALKYATNDVIYLEDLYRYWECPSGDSDNDILSCLVGAVRWRGYELDFTQLNKQIEHWQTIADKVPFKDSHQQVREYILSAQPNRTMAEIRLPNTQKETLKNFDSPESRMVLDARRAGKRLNILNKLKRAKRLYPSFTIVGTKSNRMSGTGKLSAHGIPREPEIRSIIKFKAGGDFNSFEVTIADAAFNDSKLHEHLVAGRSIHCIFGSKLYDKSEAEIRASEHDPVSAAVGGGDYYHPAKNCVFGFFYGALEDKLAKTSGVPVEKAKAVLKWIDQEYPQAAATRKKISERFQSVKQPGGRGTEVIWGDPDDKIESLIGFARYYTLENEIVRGLFELALNPMIPVEGTIVRRDREQTIENAVRSALYSVVFTIQQRNMRSANNHVIQATGAEICKALQVALWLLQPIGVHLWVIVPMNVHDEVNCDHQAGIENRISSKINETINRYKAVVPLLGIDWKFNMDSWGDK